MTYSQPTNASPTGRRGHSASPAFKAAVISALTLALLVPSLLVQDLVRERKLRAGSVADAIARDWGGTQAIQGPVVVVPFLEEVERDEIQNGVTVRKRDLHRRAAFLLPQELTVRVNAQTELRQLSIYSLPVYQADIRLEGRFSPLDTGSFRPRFEGRIVPSGEPAYLAASISELKAVKSDISLSIDGGQPRLFDPGSGDLSLSGRAAQSIQTPLTSAEVATGFRFEIPLLLNGSGSFHIAPSGRTTRVEITSNWPHPGFSGGFLPDQREINPDGFTASWSIPYLARGLPDLMMDSSLPFSSQMLGVTFVEQVDLYQTVERSVKYAIFFVTLTFLAVFLLELRAPGQVNWIQYGLTGMALVVFYVLLLALSEHIGYDLAYLTAATAVSGLIAVYVGFLVTSRKAGALMAAVLASIYGTLYLLMREEDYALLVGSFIAFLAVAITMFATRRLDWSGTTKAHVSGDQPEKTPDPA